MVTVATTQAEVRMSFHVYDLFTATLNTQTGSLSNISDYDPSNPQNIDEYVGCDVRAQFITNGKYWTGKLRKDGNHYFLANMKLHQK